MERLAAEAIWLRATTSRLMAARSWCSPGWAMVVEARQAAATAVANLEKWTMMKYQ